MVKMRGVIIRPPNHKRTVWETRIFAAYPYKFDSEQKPTYRSVLSQMEQEFAVRFRYTDDTASAAHLVVKIRDRIRNTEYSMFDLSGWNANVAFEFGVFMGMNRPMTRAWLFLDDNLSKDVPSDLQGHFQHRYSTRAEFETKLRAILDKFPKKAEVNVLRRRP